MRYWLIFLLTFTLSSAFGMTDIVGPMGQTAGFSGHFSIVGGFGSGVVNNITQVQKNGNFSANSNVIPTSLTNPTTAGDTILIFVAGAGTIITPTGFVSRNPQVNVQGFYLFEKLVASGDSTDTPTLSMSGAFNATWVIAEYSGITALDTSNGSNGGEQDITSVTTAAVIPTSGPRLIVTAVAGTAATESDTYAAGDPQGWTNSFVGQQSVELPGSVGAGLDSMIEGWSAILVTGDGVTSYSTTASWTITPTGQSTAPATIIAAYR